MELLNKKVGIEEYREIRENTLKKWAELGFLDNDKNKINIADLYESQASFLIKKEMNANEVKKDLYKSKNMAKVSHYVSGNLYYTVELEDGIYQFPIATVETYDRGGIKCECESIVTELSSDLGTTTFEAEMKGSDLNRWISKAIDKEEFIKIA
jgi:hypothetical protein